MTALLYVLGVLAFVLAILASIGLHELGHMVPAKAFGGKVTQYFIGFGPTIWSRQRGETEYGIKAIPLGGYVKIVGMLPPDKEHAGKVEYDADGNRVVTVRKSNTGLFAQLISDARAAEWETITAADEHRLFYRMDWWKKVVVMAGGPTVNLLIAFLIFAGLFATYGNPASEVLHPTVSKVEACVVPGRRGRTCLHGAGPGEPGAEGRVAGRRPVRVLQRHADQRLDRHAAPHPQQPERRGDDRRRARRPAGDSAHRHHGHAAPDRREPPDPAHSRSGSSASRRR